MPNCEINELILELTRRCNMNCAHCLRGNAQALDMPEATIGAALFPFAVGSIGTIVFGGGEPSLNVNGILRALDVCKQLNISVNNFYVVTNGKTVSEEFLLAMMKWFIYCSSCNGGYDDDMNGLALSKDCFHEDIPAENETLLRAFSFFREDKFTDWDSLNGGLINMGRARTLDENLRALSVYRPEIEENNDGGLTISDGLLYISARGDVYPACDLEYDFPGLVLCNVLCSDNWVEDIAEGADRVFGDADSITLTDEKIENLMAGAVKASA